MKGSKFAMAMALATLLSATPSGADLVTAQQCLASQLRSAGAACKGMAKCYFKAMNQGLPLSTSCIDIKKDRLVFFANEVEAVANCLVKGEARSAGDQIGMGLDDIADDLTLTGGRCAAVKMAALGKACSAFFRCNAAADRESTSLDPACVQTHAAKLVAAFTKLDAGGKCVTTNDASTEEGKIANLVDSVRLVFRGTGTTTTSSTASTR